MSKIKYLSELVGISSEYIDKTGVTRHTSDESRKYFLENMGYPCQNDDEIDCSIEKIITQNWKNGLNYVNSFFESEKPFKIELRLPKEHLSYNTTYQLFDEKKTLIKSGSLSLTNEAVIELKLIENINYCRINLDLSFLGTLEYGYYKLVIANQEQQYDTTLIIAPDKCYLIDDIKDKQSHLYGLAIQLYALRSENNMGVGDFSDLENIIKLTAEAGGDVVGINPLGTLFLDSNKDVSPYRTLSRYILNYLYVDLKRVPEYATSPKINELSKNPSFNDELSRLRTSKYVDYNRTLRLKHHLLRMMFEEFSLKELSPLTQRGSEFIKFIKTKGSLLKNVCIFESLVETQTTYKKIYDWRDFAHRFQDINSPAIKAFAEENDELVKFYAYCHWLAECQLSDAANLCKKLNMKVGLYLDTPIGASASGAELWENRETMVENIGVGAPPDPMRPRGQSWGFVPYHPQSIQKARYLPFINLMRESMQNAGALRIDHAMGLLRLFWVYYMPNDKVVRGAYIYYNMKDMVSILAIESHRSKCVMIGEDLGTVPDGFREYMFEHGLLSNKVFFRQKNKDGDFLSPDEYQYLSLAQSSTHDQATSRGYWLSEDIKTFQNCRLYVNDQQYIDNMIIRQKERELLIKAFSKENVFNDEECKNDAINKINGSEPPHKIEDAVSRYTARTQSAIFLQRVEDIYGQVEMENTPGTVSEYPNWRIKLEVDIKDIKQDGRFSDTFEMIKKERKT